MRTVMTILLLLAAGAAAAQEDGAFEIGGDRFVAGERAEIGAGAEADDVFVAGETVRLRGPVAGSAHLAGRRIEVDGRTGGDLYAAGYALELDAEVAGDATLAGYSIALDGPVGGDLRAAASTLDIEAPVAGSALLFGEFVTLDAEIAGDAAILARDIDWAGGAVVGGALRVYANRPERVSVPERVAPAERVEILPVEAFDPENEPFAERMLPTRGQLLRGFLAGILVTGLVATVVIALAPETVQRWRMRALAHPGRAVFTGFLATSALIGAGVLVAATLIGLLATPFFVLLTLLALYAGYALGAYILGVGVWRALSGAAPGTLPAKFGVAVLGAGLAAVIALVPFVGWLFLMALTLFGIGAITAHSLPRSWFLVAGEPGGEG